MNPIHKKIPILIHNGKPVYESLIILHYIDEAWPHQTLLPSHPYARSQLYDSEARIMRTKGEAQEEAKRDMLGCLEVLQGALRDMSGGEALYFGGREFGFMDITLIPFTSWFDAYESIGNFKIPLGTQFPLLKAWMQKCMERESVKKVLPSSGRISEFVAQVRKRFVTD